MTNDPKNITATGGGKPPRAPKPHPVRMQNLPAHLEGAAVLERLCFSSPWSADSLALLTNDGIGVGYVCTAPAMRPSSTAQAPAEAESAETQADRSVAQDKAAVTVTAYGGMLITVDEGQITNIAVHPDYRRAGLGTAIVRALLRHAKDCHLESVSLEVRASNAAAIALYRTAGFAEVGRRKGFYQKPVEDALVMVCRIR